MHTVQLALAHGARYMIASTSEIYGDPLVHPQREDYFGHVNTIGPRACYDETKRFAEAYVSSAIWKLGLNGAIVRIFNTYGPRMRPDDGRVVPEICIRALEGKKLTIHGDGKQTRSFCYVSDLVAGIVKLFESEIKVPVNLGNPVERTVLEFCEAVQHLTGSKLDLEKLKARPDDPKRRCPDISRAQALLSWSPQVDLMTGLQATLEEFKSELKTLKK
jgi:dTDP-glucose 4,6-dehydratase